MGTGIAYYSPNSQVMKQNKDRGVEGFLTSASGHGVAEKPMIFDLRNHNDREKFSTVASKEFIKKIVDDYEEQQKEYFGILNPTLVYRPDFENNFQDHLKTLTRDCPLWQHGRWVYFPWLFTVVHILEDEAFQTVRTARNRNLIDQTEQHKFYNSVVGIAGLSVGNSVALAMALQGGARHLKIADHDRLSLSNMNRIRTGVECLGMSKVEMTARQIWALNPYAEIEIFSDGLNKENISAFFGGPPALDVVIDEIDNLAVKCLIREHARRNKIPVVMAADNGDNGVVDIERYDNDPGTQFFHGRMGEVSYDMLAALDKFGIGRLITKHVGAENITERMQQSLLEMGKTIVSWPQLGGAALLNGSAVAYCVRKILNSEPLEDNRALISLDEKLIPGHEAPKEQEKRHKAAEEFKKIFRL